MGKSFLDNRKTCEDQEIKIQRENKAASIGKDKGLENIASALRQGEKK